VSIALELYITPIVSERVEEIFGQRSSAHGGGKREIFMHTMHYSWTLLVPGVGGDDARSMEMHDRA